MKKHGFTLIEIMIVVAIIALLVITLTTSMIKQKSKAEDARSISDLDRLKIAFEDYYNDNNCYPPSSWFDSKDDCGSTYLSPYLSAIKCNPKTGMPYTLVTDPTGCGWYELSTDLQNGGASAICESGKNFCLGSNNHIAVKGGTIPTPNPSASAGGGTPAPTPSPVSSPDPINHYYFCQSTADHNCSNFDPVTTACSPYYVNDPYCAGCNVQSSCAHL